MSLEAIVDKCCTSLEALRQHPFSTVKGKTKHRRLKAAQKLLRSLLQDGDLELSMTHKGVVFLRGGSAAWHEDQEEKDPKTLEALRVLTMARTMKLSVRSMLKVPRACRRSDLMRVREMNTPYKARPRAISTETGLRRASAANKLREVVTYQVNLAQRANAFNCVGNTLFVVTSADATPLWKSSATRCDTSVHCWLEVGDAGAPNLWPTWWAMWGGDDAAYLMAMDATHGLNEQVADLEANEDVVWQGNVLGFSCIITGDGKNLLAGNPSRVSKCWICDDDQSLLLFTGCMDGVRWGAYLRCIPVSRRVGDYVHATSRVLCILVKRLRKELHSRGIHPGVRALDAIVNDVKEACKGIPESERIAPRRAKEHTFDLTMALAFMAKPVWHGEMINVVKHYMPDVVSPAGPYIWVVVHTLLRQFATIHQFWRQKSYFNEPEVLCYCKAVEQFATGWGDLGWKVSTWVHWTCAHSPFFAKKYRNFYIFSSIPSEKKNSPFKRDLHNSCKGWALLNPRLSIFSMGHVVNMSNLDLGLLARKIMQAKEKERRGILLGRKYLK